MNPTLTLLIPADWPHQRRDCPWLLHDAAGRLLERGCSEAAHWPGVGTQAGSSASDCHLLLAGHQVACQRTQLPKTARGRTPAIIAAALEERLLDAADQLAFAVAPAVDRDGLSTVAVIAQQRLAAIVHRLGELGLTVRSAWPLAMALPTPTACALGGELDITLADGSFTSLTLDERLDDWLGQLGIATPLPLSVADPALAAPAIAAIAASRQLERQSSADDFRPPAGAGFLYGELAPPGRHQEIARHFVPAGRLAAGFALAALLLATAQWTWLSWQAQQQRQTIARHFSSVLPQTPIVDPLRQMQQRVDAGRRATGRLAANDFLALAEPLAGLPAGTVAISEMHYENGRLRIAAQLPGDGIEQLRDAARQHRLSVDIKAAPESAGAGTAILEIAAGGKP